MKNQSKNCWYKIKDIALAKLGRDKIDISSWFNGIRKNDKSNFKGF